MKINGHHLSYCTNIHPGESWAEVEYNLHTYLPEIKNAVSPDGPFGIGLRLSNRASQELLQGDQLKTFKNWLQAHDYYVFTFNGFPYGGFHRQVVKDEVHQPDWTTPERLDYTLRLFKILAELLPAGTDGGISTSPLSYKYWHKDAESTAAAKQKATRQLAKVAADLYRISQESGKLLHLDIEPEPDGLIENTEEVIDYYREWLIPQGSRYLKNELGISAPEAESCLKNHIRICYDVCHFAIVYEEPEEVFAKLEREGIQIGKIQISAALKAGLGGETSQKAAVQQALAPFVESTYLHQVVEREPSGSLTHYPDLPAALLALDKEGPREWRTHFHVPVFLSSYGRLESTQEDILKVLDYIRQQDTGHQLEVETYTWEVLPDDIRLDLSDSIIRELQWVKDNL
jgi:hypothetical protein